MENDLKIRRLNRGYAIKHCCVLSSPCPRRLHCNVFVPCFIIFIGDNNVFIFVMTQMMNGEGVCQMFKNIITFDVGWTMMMFLTP